MPHDTCGQAYCTAAGNVTVARWINSLVRVLQDWSPSFDGLFLYYPGHRQVPVALRALIDMLRSTRWSVPAKGLLGHPFSAE